MEYFEIKVCQLLYILIFKSIFIYLSPCWSVWKYVTPILFQKSSFSCRAYHDIVIVSCFLGRLYSTLLSIKRNGLNCFFTCVDILLLTSFSFQTFGIAFCSILYSIIQFFLFFSLRKSSSPEMKFPYASNSSSYYITIPPVFKINCFSFGLNMFISP